MEKLKDIFDNYIFQILLVYLPSISTAVWGAIKKPDSRILKVIVIVLLLFALVFVGVWLIWPPTPFVPKQIFVEGIEVSLEAGNGTNFIERLKEGENLPIRDVCFSGIGSLSFDADTLYALDYSTVCAINGGGVTVPDTSYGEGEDVRILRVRHGNVYFLTELWEEAQNAGEYKSDTALMMRFGRIRDGVCSLVGAEPLEIGYIDGATRNYIEKTAVTDFDVASNQNIWFLEQYTDFDIVTLQRLPYDPETDSYGYQENWLTIPDVTCEEMTDARVTIDKWDNLYISLPERGRIIVVPGEVIQSDTYQEDCFPFAGKERGKNTPAQCIDGKSPAFRHPTALACHENYLYVWDKDALRRITVEGARKKLPSCVSCATLAGVCHYDGETYGLAIGKGDNVKFATSDEASLTVRGDGKVYLSDSVNNVIYLIG